MTQRDVVYSMLRRAHKAGVTNGAFTRLAFCVTARGSRSCAVKATRS
jgi:hypothetical protein